MPHFGIPATRAAVYVRMENGLLHVDLAREISGGDEAPGDPDHELPYGPGGQANLGRCLRLRPVRFWKRPGFSGRFRFVRAPRATSKSPLSQAAFIDRTGCKNVSPGIIASPSSVTSFRIAASLSLHDSALNSASLCARCSGLLRRSNHLRQVRYCPLYPPVRIGCLYQLSVLFLATRDDP